MKLYLLRPIDSAVPNPWEPWYNKVFGFVIQAESEEAARRFADEDAGDENRPVDENGRYVHGADTPPRHPWLSGETSSCVLLTEDGVEKIILRDFAAA